MRLFFEQGFEETSVEQVAAAAGIGRRTFFRYFASKNDAVWGDFDASLERLRAWFAACPPSVPLLAAVRDGVIAFNRFDPAVEEVHRRRMWLILTVPALQAHSTLRFAAWRAVVAEFAAGRPDGRGPGFLPQLVGHVALGAAVAGYEQWLRRPGSSLEELLAESFDTLRAAGGAGRW